MKRLLSGLLIACLLAGVFLFAPLQRENAEAATGLQAGMTVSSAQAQPGDQVTLTVSLKDNPGLAYLGIPIIYDDSCLEADPENDFEGAGLQGWTIHKNAIWCEAVNTTYTGDILSLTFRIKDNVAVGTKIDVGLGTVEAWTADYDPVNIAVEAGTITVTNVKHTHTLIKTEEKPATDAIDGHTAYWTCSGCGKIFKDASGQTEISLADTLIEAKGLKCLEVADQTARAGEEISVPISLTENPGFAFLNFLISYDKSRLELTGFEDAGLSGWTVGIGAGEKAIWADKEDTTVTGNILTLKFKVLDDIAAGSTAVKVTDIDAFNVNGDSLRLAASDGTVTVDTSTTERLPGDVTGDGKVNGSDLLRLSRYLAKYKVTINESNADVTGDGKVNGSDLLRLSRYLAKYKVVLN